MYLSPFYRWKTEAFTQHSTAKMRIETKHLQLLGSDHRLHFDQLFMSKVFSAEVEAYTREQNYSNFQLSGDLITLSENKLFSSLNISKRTGCTYQQPSLLRKH